MKRLSVRTDGQTDFVNITGPVQAAVKELGVKDAVVTVFVPHTTAGVTINENADPDVVHDLGLAFDRMVPWSQPGFRHGEGNSAAHAKATLTGSSVQVLVRGGLLQLGTWQAIYFCEFDGPRTREVWIADSGMRIAD
jgi:secondary thiamine-phosphate synthase enzyme